MKIVAKGPFRLTSVDAVPFYGVKNAGHILCTIDGIQIDTDMNAIDTNGDPTPGLYVASNDSGRCFANTYSNLSTGMATGRAMTFACLVDKHLAKL